MKQVLLTGLLVILFAMLGCEKSGDTRQPGQNATSEAVTGERGIHVPAPDEPLWPEGTTFNDSTRMATIVVRSLALDQIYNRAVSEYGSDLKGVVSVRMLIEPSGVVSQVELLDDNWNKPYAESLTDSMLFNIQLWTFPPGLDAPLAWVQPFKFER
ncbi:hypothetical protein KQI52_13250 [bacterium]|nr:hypothetical protein [bacterium]